MRFILLFIICFFGSTFSANLYSQRGEGGGYAREVKANKKSRESKERSICRKAVDRHYDRIANKRTSLLTPSARNRSFFRGLDKDSCKDKSNRRSDNHEPKSYSVDDMDGGRKGKDG